MTGGSAVATAFLAVSACGTGDSSARDVEGAFDSPTAAAVDADSELVEVVGSQLTTALNLAAATASSFPRLRPLARRLSVLHRAHLRELGQPDDAEDGGVRGTAETAQARLLRAEEKLQQELVSAALDAESGALAQVFAAMAAAVAQERTVAS